MVYSVTMLMTEENTHTFRDIQLMGTNERLDAESNVIILQMTKVIIKTVRIVRFNATSIYVASGILGY